MGPRSKGGAPSRSNHIHPILLFHDDRNNLSWCSSIVQHITKKITTKRTQRPKATPAFSFGGRWQHWHLPPLFETPTKKKKTPLVPHRKTDSLGSPFVNYRFNTYQQTERAETRTGSGAGSISSAFAEVSSSSFSTSFLRWWSEKHGWSPRFFSTVECPFSSKIKGINTREFFTPRFQGWKFQQKSIDVSLPN